VNSDACKSSGREAKPISLNNSISFGMGIEPFLSLSNLSNLALKIPISLLLFKPSFCLRASYDNSDLSLGLQLKQISV
jgi:hypothetical protein